MITSFPKESIIIANDYSRHSRKLEMNQLGSHTYFTETYQSSAYKAVTQVKISPEELAYAVLSMSGEFQERYSNRLEHLQNGVTNV